MKSGTESPLSSIKEINDADLTDPNIKSHYFPIEESPAVLLSSGFPSLRNSLKQETPDIERMQIIRQSKPQAKSRLLQELELLSKQRRETEDDDLCFQGSRPTIIDEEDDLLTSSRIFTSN